MQILLYGAASARGGSVFPVHPHGVPVIAEVAAAVEADDIVAGAKPAGIFLKRRKGAGEVTVTATHKQ
jgi:hypothetical protein